MFDHLSAAVLKKRDIFSIHVLVIVFFGNNMSL